MSEQPDVDPDGTELRKHASGDLAPEQGDSAMTDELPAAEAPPAAPDSPVESTEQRGSQLP